MTDILDVLKDNLDRRYNGHTCEEVLNNFRQFLTDLQESITDSIKDNQSIPSVEALKTPCFWTILRANRRGKHLPL